MSDINEKEASKLNGVQRRQERNLRETAEKRKVKITAVTIVAVLAVLFACALFINSKYIRRNFTALTISGVKFSAADYGYFFNSTYYEYQSRIYETFPDYAASMLPSSDKPLKSQIYSEETGETWADFLKDSTVAAMSEKALLYSEALNAGFEMPEDSRAAMEGELAALEENASTYGYPSFDKYIQTVYGGSMNEKQLRKLAEIVFTADSYSEHVRESFAYTDEQMSSYYAENKDKLDTFTYRYLLVTMDTVNESDYATTEEYETAKNAALEDSKVKAEAIASGITSEEDFIAAAAEHDPETLAEPDSTLRHYKGELLGSVYGDWLRDSSRQYGDVTTAEFSNGCYVVFFGDRSDNSYNMVEMRQLLIAPESVNAGDYESGEEYEAAVEQAKKDAEELAEFVRDIFTRDGATEELLIELIGEYSDDAMSEDGLYENVYRWQKPGEVDAWLFDPARVSGDYELIKTEEGSYLVYFKGTSGLYNEYLADEGMRKTDFDEWKEGLGTAEVKTHWTFVLAG